MTPRLIAGPLQGYTEAPWRRAHAEIFGGVDEYYLPFARIDHGAVRPKDVRELTSPFNVGLTVIPQVIARDADELALLADTIAAQGFTRVDLNMGCPFVPQMKKGRGAALLDNPERLQEMAAVMAARPSIAFSAKMRLGTTDPYGWRAVLPQLNAMPLTEVTIHPRTATQKYDGELHEQAFSELMSALDHPVVYNGGVNSAADVERILTSHPDLAGVMTGRGLLARPSLLADFRSGSPMSPEELLERTLRLHDDIFNHYRDTLCGDAQILMKIKPFWDYLEPLIGHRPFKAIGKAGSLAKYQRAVADISFNP